MKAAGFIRDRAVYCTNRHLTKGKTCPDRWSLPMDVEPHWQEVMRAQWASMLCVTPVTRAASRAGAM